jgi:hypothetical protein
MFKKKKDTLQACSSLIIIAKGVTSPLVVATVTTKLVTQTNRLGETNRPIQHYQELDD